MNPRLVISSVLVLAVGGAFFLSAGRPPVPEVSPTPGPLPGQSPEPRRDGAPDGPFHPENVRIATLPRTESLPAVVQAPEEIVLTCALLSPFVEIPVREGQAVRRGDLLARVNREPSEKMLAAARAAGDAAKEAKALADLAATELRAPTDGIVFRLEVRLGELPPRNRHGPRPVVTLLDWTAIRFLGKASGETGRLVAGGAPLFVRVGEGRRTPAKATSVGEPDAAGTVALEVRPGQPPDAAPAPGASGEILVLTGDREALVVPAAAILLEKGQTVVYVVTAGGDLVRKPVTRGESAEGDRVEVTGLTRFDGVAVWEPKR